MFYLESSVFHVPKLTIYCNCDFHPMYFCNACFGQGLQSCFYEYIFDLRKEQALCFNPTTWTCQNYYKCNKQ